MTDALTALDRGAPGIARDILVRAQQDAEETYLEAEQPGGEGAPSSGPNERP